LVDGLIVRARLNWNRDEQVKPVARSANPAMAAQSVALNKKGAGRAQPHGAPGGHAGRPGNTSKIRDAPKAVCHYFWREGKGHRQTCSD